MSRSIISDMVASSGLTYEELGIRSGLSPNIIARWCSGKNSPTLHNFMALAETCGCEFKLVKVNDVKPRIYDKSRGRPPNKHKKIDIPLGTEIMQGLKL